MSGPTGALVRKRGKMVDASKSASNSSVENPTAQSTNHWRRDLNRATLSISAKKTQPAKIT